MLNGKENRCVEGESWTQFQNTQHIGVKILYIQKARGQFLGDEAYTEVLKNMILFFKNSYFLNRFSLELCPRKQRTWILLTALTF